MANNDVVSGIEYDGSSFIVYFKFKIFIIVNLKASFCQPIAQLKLLLISKYKGLYCFYR